MMSVMGKSIYIVDEVPSGWRKGPNCLLVTFDQAVEIAQAASFHNGVKLKELLDAEEAES